MSTEIPRPDIIIARHGETNWNTASPTTGFAEISLTDEGNRQAEILANEIVKLFGVDSIARIITTPYIRTHQTAVPLIERTGLEPVVMPSMKEITYLQSSKAEGKTFDERRELRKAFWAAARVNPDYMDKGEDPVDSPRSFVGRIHDSLDQLALPVKSEAGLSVVFSHEFPIFAAIGIATGKSDDDIIAEMVENQTPVPAIKNTRTVGLTYNDGKWTIAHDSHVDLFKSSREQ